MRRGVRVRMASRFGCWSMRGGEAGVGAHAAGAAGLALLRHRPAWRAACCVARHLLQWADYRLSDSGAHEAGFVSEHHGLDAVP